MTDDGQGLPHDHAQGRGYGMKLVRMMATQIGAALEINTDGAGARFMLKARPPEMEYAR